MCLSGTFHWERWSLITRFTLYPCSISWHYGDDIECHVWICFNLIPMNKVINPQCAYKNTDWLSTSSAESRCMDEFLPSILLFKIYSHVLREGRGVWHSRSRILTTKLAFLSHWPLERGQCLALSDTCRSRCGSRWRWCNPPGQVYVGVIAILLQHVFGGSQQHVNLILRSAFKLHIGLPTDDSS